MRARTNGMVHMDPHAHHARSRGPSVRKTSRSLCHGVSASSPTTSRTSSSPEAGGMLHIALNDHQGTSPMAEAQSSDEREVAGTGDARDARSVTHPYTAAHAETSRAVDASQRRR